MKNVKTILAILITITLSSCSNDPKQKKSVISNQTTSNILEDKVIEPKESKNEVDQKTKSLNIWDSVEIKANWFMENNPPQRDLNKISPNFMTFYQRFITDSLFQMKHIEFSKFIGVMAECENTIRYNTNNWEYTNWDFTMFFNENNHAKDIVKNEYSDVYIESWNNTFYQSSDRFYYQFYLREAGWIYKVGFEKVNGVWKLTLYEVNAC